MDYKIQKSKDGVIKVKFKEGYSSVIIPTKDGKNTICVSCQIGCPVKCKFCYSAKAGFKRSLTYEEILLQVKIAKKIIGKKPTSVVFMGMGEPLLNLKNVLDAAEEIHNKFLVAYHRITLSTSGLKNINKLISTKFNIAISFHSPFDKIRKTLMPFAISINKILNFAGKYCKKHHKKNYIMIEYALIKGINDREKDLKKLLELKWPKRTLFNLIEFNEIGKYKKANDKVYEKFKKEIIKKGFKCFIRKSRGRDIKASCGMLDYSR
jgi:23S rRNA (adenine2503-C2)-methyltransferase